MAKGSKRDTSGLEVIRQFKYGDEANVTEYLFSVTGNGSIERRNYLYEYHFIRDSDTDYGSVAKDAKKGDYRYDRRTETKQKFLCVGGPLAGKRVTEALGYSAYNAANFNRGRNRQTEYRVVFVHDSLLKGEA
jgi:hypothetical protein